MSLSARTIAENASSQTFINCYLREIDPGCWYKLATWRDTAGCLTPMRGPFVLESKLNSQQARLAIDVGYRSLVGKHRLGCMLIRYDKDSEWTTIAPLDAALLLVKEMYWCLGNRDSESFRIKETELTCRLLESYQLMTRYIEARRDDPTLDGDRFIESEQSMLYGHWAHPTPKSRQGMLDWHHHHYSPELSGQFQLHYFAARRDVVVQYSASLWTAEDMTRHTLTGYLDGVPLSPREVLIPCHPLQAQWLLHQPYVREAMATGLIRDLGLLGPLFTPTSSVRTLYCEQSHWMYKLSMPVKITNSLRFNQCHELRAGVVMAKLLRQSDFIRRFPRFKILEDPASLSVVLPGIEQTGFETIIRANPFLPGRDRGIHSIAALVQEPLPGRPSRLQRLINTLAQEEGRTEELVSRDWFSRYWDCSVEPLIRLFDEHGIALEAHQQNSLLDVSQGYPRCYYYRDNQGFYLSPDYRQHLEALESAVTSTPELFYPEELIRERFSYYLIFNQMFSVIHRFGADDLLKEEALLSLAVKRLVALRSRLQGAGRALLDRLLTQREIPYKSNLLTRAQDIDELTANLEQAVYTRVKNPLAIFSYGVLPEVSCEVA